MTRSSITDVVHPPAVAVGALVTLAVAVPAALIAQALDATDRVDDDSGWLIVLFLVIVGAMVGGGYVAAQRRPDAPLANGALAALSAYVLVQGIGVIRLLAAGDDVTWLALPVFALLSSASGMTGGLYADHRARNPRR